MIQWNAKTNIIKLASLNITTTDTASTGTCLLCCCHWSPVHRGESSNGT